MFPASSLNLTLHIHDNHGPLCPAIISLHGIEISYAGCHLHPQFSNRKCLGIMMSAKTETSERLAKKEVFRKVKHAIFKVALVKDCATWAILPSYEAELQCSHAFWLASQCK